MIFKIEELKTWIRAIYILRQRGIIQNFQEGLELFRREMQDVALDIWVWAIYSLVRQGRVIDYKELKYFLEHEKFNQADFLESYYQCDINEPKLQVLNKLYDFKLRIHEVGKKRLRLS